MQEVFSYKFGDILLYADALRVRRLLLEHTDGRAWTYVRDQANLKHQFKELTENKLYDGEPVEGERLESLIAVNRMSQARLEGMLAGATVKAFELTPFNPEDGSGCTELSALTLLSLYMEFAAGKD